MSTTLVVLAAGMGSRYGGLKQIDPIGPNGEVILELSVYDAIQAGFDKVVFIIKKAIEKEFKEAIGDKLSKQVHCEYVFQDFACVPEGFKVPEGREKPLGTAHALYCCKDVLDGPFAVINSDDYYGQSCFKTLYDFLNNEACAHHFAMVGYVLRNTLTDHGSVARGQCIVENGKLVNVIERTKIEKRDGKVQLFLDNEWQDIDPDTLVSMNMWAFTPDIIDEITQKFKEFQQVLEDDPMKGEFYIPNVVGELLREHKCDVKMLESHDKWYGVTYQEDKESVKEGIASLYKKGCYPEPLWK
ncbi:sugar phosphate nucleotidyltransferase [uncultured Traorella sp.]|uniref:nucleotidyltransferase family protein n=1 Tax=uncultured Traorella sp. TaxID=1929048 RepID=UPI0025F56DF2|nr:sugar phosphate nucleotidyltransferase [uncultured Traorella sp.]